MLADYLSWHPINSLSLIRTRSHTNHACHSRPWTRFLSGRSVKFIPLQHVTGCVTCPHTCAPSSLVCLSVYTVQLTAAWPRLDCRPCKDCFAPTNHMRCVCCASMCFRPCILAVRHTFSRQRRQMSSDRKVEAEQLKISKTSFLFLRKSKRRNKNLYILDFTVMTRSY